MNRRLSVEFDQQWRLGVQWGGRNVLINSTTRCRRPTLLLLLLPGSVWFWQNLSNRAQTLSGLRVCSQKMGACGWRNKIDWSLELDDLKKSSSIPETMQWHLGLASSMACSRKDSRSAASAARARGSRGPLLLATIVRASRSTMRAFLTILLMQCNESQSILCKKWSRCTRSVLEALA